MLGIPKRPTLSGMNREVKTDSSSFCVQPVAVRISSITSPVKSRLPPAISSIARIRSSMIRSLDMKLPFGYLEQGKDRDTLHQMAMERNSDCMAVRHVTNAWTGSDGGACPLRYYRGIFARAVDLTCRPVGDTLFNLTHMRMWAVACDAGGLICSFASTIPRGENARIDESSS